jgi:hypothetical protein
MGHRAVADDLCVLRAGQRRPRVRSLVRLDGLLWKDRRLVFDPAWQGVATPSNVEYGVLVPPPPPAPSTAEGWWSAVRAAALHPAQLREDLVAHAAKTAATEARNDLRYAGALKRPSQMTEEQKAEVAAVGEHAGRRVRARPLALGLVGPDWADDGRHAQTEARWRALGKAALAEAHAAKWRAARAAWDARFVAFAAAHPEDAAWLAAAH